LGDPGVDGRIILSWSAGSGIWEYVLDRSSSGQGQVAGIVNAVMNIRVPWNAGNFLTGWKSVSFSIRTLLHGVWSIVHLFRFCFKPQENKEYFKWGPSLVFLLLPLQWARKKLLFYWNENGSDKSSGDEHMF
jgi:hypothetical protein